MLPPGARPLSPLRRPTQLLAATQQQGVMVPLPSTPQACPVQPVGWSPPQRRPLPTVLLGSGLCTPIQHPALSTFSPISPVNSAESPAPRSRMRNGGWNMVGTPEPTRRNLTTPPSGPEFLLCTVDEDIEAALAQGSASLLQLALTCSHSCTRPHCVHEAVKRQNLRALEFLLNFGTRDMDDQCGGLRPLHVALQVCATEGDAGFAMVDMLLRNGARPEYCEGDMFCGDMQEGPLHDVARRGCAASVALLLKHGADPNALDAAGNTPLHALCRQAAPWSSSFSDHVISQLLHAGACPSIANSAGHTPSACAWDQGLRMQVWKAERWFGRSALLVALGRSDVSASRPCRGVASISPLGSPFGPNTFAALPTFVQSPSTGPPHAAPIKGELLYPFNSAPHGCNAPILDGLQHCTTRAHDLPTDGFTFGAGVIESARSGTAKRRVGSRGSGRSSHSSGSSSTGASDLVTLPNSASFVYSETRIGSTSSRSRSSAASAIESSGFAGLFTSEAPALASSEISDGYGCQDDVRENCHVEEGVEPHWCGSQRASCSTCSSSELDVVVGGSPSQDARTDLSTILPEVLEAIIGFL